MAEPGRENFAPRGMDDDADPSQTAINDDLAGQSAASWPKTANPESPSVETRIGGAVCPVPT